MLKLQKFNNKYLLGWLIVSVCLSFLLLSMSREVITLSTIVSWTFGISCLSLAALGLSYLKDQKLTQPEIIWWIFPICAVFFFMQKAMWYLCKIIWILRPFPKDPHDY